MSNDINQYTGKNPAWERSNPNQNLMGDNNPHINVLQSQLMNQGLNNINNSNMIQFPQQHPQVFQGALGMQQQTIGLGFQQMANNAMASSHSQLTNNQIFQQVGTVSYPNPRALNSAAFQTNPNISAIPQNQCNPNPGMKQKVFTGKVTKVHDNFGFVDDDVFFQTNACIKGSNPVVGDRVLVEASYNPSMPFKWNATKIQVLPTGSNQQSRNVNASKSYNTNSNNSYNTISPSLDSNGSFGNRSNRTKNFSSRGRDWSRDKERDDDEPDKKRRREERLREREKEDKKSPVRRRSRSPKARRRPRIVPRYMVQIPKITLNLSSADVLEIKRRYGNMYIPSDFFYSNIRWVDVFPSNKPFSLSKPCSFHIMSKDANFVTDAILEPNDADYSFSAKVMLISLPGLDEIYHKCCSMAEDEDKKDRDAEERDFIHPSRMINFLIGLRGKNETMTIGGPWSPSLDGPNPDKDPSVLIKTATRTCKALTGIDLSSCTQWYRFVELYYRRSESVHKGKVIPARVETVIIFLPDVWSCVPTRLEWDNLVKLYQKPMEGDTFNPDTEQADIEQQATDEKEEDHNQDKGEPTHYSLLDLKSMSVQDIKRELKVRGANCKGLKNQLVARLSKLLKSEADKGASLQDVSVDIGNDSECFDDERKMELDDKKVDEKEKMVVKKKFTLPDQQHIIVHPSKTAKSGKFDCTVMSLSLLLDYRPEDTKEHSFEVSLFAELFNEMLMRDFGFNIYKALFELPDKSKEREDKKKKDDDKRKDDKKKDDRKKEDDLKEKDKNNDKKDDGKEDKKIDKKSDDSEDEYDDDDDKDRRRDKDKKKKLRFYTAEKHLLLSFVYFDQTHCGYIFDKDVEDLFYTLGLNLSRAQVKKLLSKAITRDSLHYRKLTDKSRDENNVEVVKSNSESDMHVLAMGNKILLPVFGEAKGNNSTKESSDEINSQGLFMYQGALVDVKKLMCQLERSDNARLDTESRMVNLKNENSKLLEKYNKMSLNAKHVSNELKDYKDKLRNTEESLLRVTSQCRLLSTTLSDVKDKIDPVLKNSVSKDDIIKKEIDECFKKDKKYDDNTRWEKDCKPDEIIKNE